jgi:predicted 3-demethylubiquinone-9 3-methyltransferase (glyoxalase superfamily)
MTKITPFLWFDTQALEAAEFYVSVFPNSKIDSISYYPENSPGNASKVMTVDFNLDGNQFIALNGGPLYKFTYATSFYIHCDTQEQIDHYWEKLSEGGQKVECGWLQDKYGVPWQIVPEILGKLMADPDKKKSGAVVTEMLKMTKLVISDLMRAYEQA